MRPLAASAAAGHSCSHALPSLLITLFASLQALHAEHRGTPHWAACRKASSRCACTKAHAIGSRLLASGRMLHGASQGPTHGAPITTHKP